jgi:hypothetical protein
MSPISGLRLGRNCHDRPTAFCIPLRNFNTLDIPRDTLTFWSGTRFPLSKGLYTQYLTGRPFPRPLHACTHELTTEQQSMEQDRIPSRYKNPLYSLSAARARPVKTVTKPPDQHFPIMKLLPELRIRIYECVFADIANYLTPRSLSTIQNLEDHLQVRLGIFFALLHASRALRFEALEVYCLYAKARLATLGETIKSMYAQIDVMGKAPDWTILMEAHVRELVIGRLETLLRVIKFVMSDGKGKSGWSFAALKFAMVADVADRMGCD